MIAKRALSALLALAMTAALLTSFAYKEARTPILIGDPITDWMVDDLLDSIGARELTDDTARIRACYDWIIKNCAREGEENPHYDSDKLFASYSELSTIYGSEYRDGRAAVYVNMDVDRQYWETSSYSSTSYIDSCAGFMALYRVGDCTMFSGLFAVMLMHLGYECCIVEGQFINSGGSQVMHKWNLAFVDGTPYWFDIRMDHSGYESSGRISYTYFMKTDDDAWAKKHVWTRAFTDSLKAQHAAGRRMYAYDGVDYTALPLPDWSNCSAWAQDYLTQAQQRGLIPAALKGADMTQPITRQEFAAVAVTLWQTMAGRTAQAPDSSPFRDTSDENVLKAYNLGVVNGKTADVFDPQGLLTREQGAAMLGRAYEAVQSGRAGDGSGLSTAGSTPFADHDWISAYAQRYVYFLNANGVIDGVGEGRFDPAGSITREAALKIAVVMAKNLR